jgi:hypothetical protein|tara:strand:- start:194 stop:547 length:354 start_codon:yes stop_codon:yes gene_type:complete
MTNMQRALQILADDLAKKNGNRLVGMAEVSNNHKWEYRKMNSANPRTRFTKEQAEEIILGMKVGESMLLKNESERGLFYSVAREINWSSHLDVAVTTQFIEVDGDDMHMQLRMWRSK